MSIMISDLSIIIPAYNEAKRIGVTLAAIQEYSVHSPINIQVVIVDDGSTDETVSVVQQRRQQHVRIVQLPKNSGKFAALKKGVEEATSSCVLFYDADGATPIAMLDKALPLTRKNACIIGSRAHADTKIMTRQSIARVLAGRMGNTLIRLLTGLKTKDSQCGFKLVKTEAARTVMSRMTVDRFAGDIEFLHLLEAMGYSTAEIGVEWRDVPVSTVRFRDYKQTLRDLLRIRRNIKNKYYTFL